MRATDAGAAVTDLELSPAGDRRLTATNPEGQLWVFAECASLLATNIRGTSSRGLEAVASPPTCGREEGARGRSRPGFGSSPSVNTAAIPTTFAFTFASTSSIPSTVLPVLTTSSTTSTFRRSTRWRSFFI